MRLSGIATALLSLSLLGCSGAADLDGEGPPAVVTTSDLTVLVWSDVRQMPVGATGVVIWESDGSSMELDTRANPAVGQTFNGLQPGRYRVEVTRRYEGETVKEVEGSEAVYVEPGAPREVTVVVEDREDELG